MGAYRHIAISKYPIGLSKDELFDTPKLSLAFLRMNNLCNAKCEFCDVWKTPQVDADRKIDMVALWRELEALNPSEVNIHGGEAFLSRDFLNILDCNVRTPISITTNGTVFSAKILQRIRARGRHLNKFYISIDHVDAARNARSRGIKWLENNLFDAIRVVKNEVESSVIIVNHVVSSLNCESIDKLLITMSELRVDSVNLIPIKDYPALFLTRENVRGFMARIGGLLEAGYIHRNLFMDANYTIFGTTEEDYARAEKGIYGGSIKKSCAIPLTTMFIDAVTGNVYPCDTTMYRQDPGQYVMGNILNESLQAIWTGRKFDSFRRRMFPAITCECINGCDPANTLR
jgi:radical SAM protein with 4Fe4S-binding SPASM domain